MVLLLSFCFAVVVCPAQKVQGSKPSPSAWTETTFVVLDAVVTERWPHMLPLVNMPADIRLLNPGQCVRAAVIATGDHNEDLLKTARIRWSVTQTGGKREEFAAATPAASRQIKPEGWDNVRAALHAGNVDEKQLAPMRAGFAHLAVSAARWCVPQGASDGDVQVEAAVEDGTRTTRMKSATVQVESLATAAGKTFKDVKELQQFSMHYHDSPEPGRLLPMMAFLVSSNLQEMNAYAFLRAAYVHDRETVRGFGPLMAEQNKLAQMLALNLMSKAGVTLDASPALSDEDRKNLAAAPDLPDAYAAKPGQNFAQLLDFLWSEFTASGEYRPVAAVAAKLAWQPDYVAFRKMMDSGEKPKALTDGIMRGVSYTAAGWSLGSFERTDGLAADYIESMIADPQTPEVVRQELKVLGTDPAFKMGK